MTINDKLSNLLARRWASDALGEDYVKWALDALEAGWDTPSLRILAGLNLTSPLADIEPYFLSVLKELSIEEPAPDEMPLHYLRYVCRAIMTRTITPDQGIDLIHKRVINPLGHPKHLMHWCFLWEGNNPDGSFAELKGIERDNIIIEYARKEIASKTEA